jgi:hypothetical protein
MMVVQKHYCRYYTTPLNQLEKGTFLSEQELVDGEFEQASSLPETRYIGMNFLASDRTGIKILV